MSSCDIDWFYHQIQKGGISPFLSAPPDQFFISDEPSQQGLFHVYIMFNTKTFHGLATESDLDELKCLVEDRFSFEEVISLITFD